MGHWHRGDPIPEDKVPVSRTKSSKRMFHVDSECQYISKDNEFLLKDEELARQHFDECPSCVKEEDTHGPGTTDRLTPREITKMVKEGELE